MERRKCESVRDKWGTCRENLIRSNTLVCKKSIESVCFYEKRREENVTVKKVILLSGLNSCIISLCGEKPVLYKKKLEVHFVTS